MSPSPQILIEEDTASFLALISPDQLHQFLWDLESVEMPVLPQAVDIEKWDPVGDGPLLGL